MDFPLQMAAIFFACQIWNNHIYW